MKRQLILLLCLLCIIYTVACTKKENNKIVQEEMEGIIFNTGKSDAILIRYEGYVILIDTAYDENKTMLIEYLKDNDIKKIDYMILTHLDKDHIGGADGIIEAVLVENILKPAYESDSKEYKEFLEACNEKSLTLKTLDKNFTIMLKDMNISISTAKEKEYDDENDYSLITTIEYKNVRMLFMGDAEKRRCKEFLSDIKGTYDFVKLPHHGDTNKYLESILTYGKFKYGAVTLESEDNMEEGFKDKLNSLGIKTYYNCNGNIVFGIADGEFIIGQSN